MEKLLPLVLVSAAVLLSCHVSARAEEGEAKAKAEAKTETKTETKVTVWLIGDSTVASYAEDKRPLAGWGQMLPQFCRPGVAVENKAVGGRSTKSFIDEKRWDEVKKGLKKGDCVLIQFGHNDEKKEDPKRYTVPEESYSDNLKLYIAEARAAGAAPVLVTPVARRKFSEDGKPVDTHAKYSAAMRKVAEAEKVPLVDLSKLSMDLLAELGPEKSVALFNHTKPGEWPGFPQGGEDNTHFNETGAATIAGVIVKDLVRQNLPLAELFNAPADTEKN